MSEAHFKRYNADQHRTPSGGRDHAIDIIRGYCIISMVTGHIAGATVLSSAFHLFPKFDGASGFVLLSGLVLGRVQSRRVVSLGLASVQRQTSRRVIFVYIAQVILALLGCLAVIAGWRNPNYPSLDALSPLEIVTNILLMTLAPPGGDVLRLYVFLLGIAMVGYVLLVRGQWVILVTLSVALHATAQVYPRFTSFSPFVDQAPSAGWAGWQLLFVTALILGWYWQQLDIATWLDRHATKVFSVCVLTAVAVAAISHVVSPALDDVLFSKFTFPLGRILAAYAVVTALYVATRWILSRFPRLWLRPVLMIGKASMDSYIIQALAVILVFGFTPVASSSVSSMLLSALTLLACWGWVEGRAHRRLTKRVRQGSRAGM